MHLNESHCSSISNTIGSNHTNSDEHLYNNSSCGYLKYFYPDFNIKYVTATKEYKKNITILPLFLTQYLDISGDLKQGRSQLRRIGIFLVCITLWRTVSALFGILVNRFILSASIRQLSSPWKSPNNLNPLSSTSSSLPARLLLPFRSGRHTTTTGSLLSSSPRLSKLTVPSATQAVSFFARVRATTTTK